MSYGQRDQGTDVPLQLFREKEGKRSSKIGEIIMLPGSLSGC